MRRRLYALAFVGTALFGLGIPAGWNAYRAALGPLEISQADTGSTIVVDREGRLLRAFTTIDGRWRLPLKVADVDPRFIAMLETYEDRRFEQHLGIDWRAMVRAAGQFMRHGRVVSGGSTLTMQVARLIEPRDQRTISAKLRQMVRAVEIEETVGKEGVLNLYLQLAPYGGNLEGLRAASLAYFGKEPKRLSIAESALLVALPQSPELRRPDHAPLRARAARDRVLDRALSHGLISSADARAAKTEAVPHERWPFPAFAPHASEAALKFDPDTRVVHLTLDYRLQTGLEQLAHDAVLRLGPRVSAAILVVDNLTGEIRAHVGAANYLSEERGGSLDMTQALRSPGSTLKPFIYAMAFENGIAHPETVLDDRASRYGQYQPENFDLTFQGTITARRALQNSLNLPAVELLSEIGPARFLARLRNSGAGIVLPKDAAPSLAMGLGGLGITLNDLAGLYVGLARGGAMPELIERTGEVAQPSQRRISEPVAAWYVTDILRGAPPPLNAPAGRIAFKTGTSYGFRDAFAVGYDRRTTIAVWIGRPDNGAVPGLIGRQIAAPVLFDAFARLGLEPDFMPRPRDALVATTANLPPPLRHLHHDAPKTMAGANVGSLKIAYPPDGARVDLGLKAKSGGTLALKALGGVPPLIWMVNGTPVGEPDLRRQSMWQPDGAGFARVSVMDARGASDSVVVRLE